MSHSKRMEMSMAYLWHWKEAALSQAPGWSVIRRVLKLTLFPVLLTIQANLQDL